MLPFVLYAATGGVTGCHIYFLLVLGRYGVPQNIWEFVALLLSLCIVICAYISIYRPILAARIALVSALGMWCFYGPAIVATVRAGHLKQLIKMQGAALPCSAVVLLLVTTAYSFAVSGRKNEPGRDGTWLFPGRMGRWGRITIGVTTLAVLVAFSAWFAMGMRTSRRPTSRFLIPDGYVGWVHVEFNVADAQPALSEQGQYIFHVPADGKLKTASPERFGWANDEYFYVSAAGLHRLATGAVNGRMVWGKINGERGDPAARRQYEAFFVGTEQQFKESAGNGSTGRDAPAPPPK